MHPVRFLDIPKVKKAKEKTASGVIYKKQNYRINNKITEETANLKNTLSIDLK